MKDIEKIKKMLKAQKIYLRKKYKVKKIGIFGSCIRREANKKSDLDILVDFAGVVDFFDFLALEEELSEILKVKVDLVMKKALKPAIGRRIMEEVVYA